MTLDPRPLVAHVMHRFGFGDLENVELLADRVIGQLAPVKLADTIATALLGAFYNPAKANERERPVRIDADWRSSLDAKAAAYPDLHEPSLGPCDAGSALVHRFT